MNKVLGALALAVAAAAPAHAYTVTTLAANGNELDTSFSDAGMLSVDYGFKHFGDVVLQIDVDAGDGATLSFNALMRNLIGLGISGLALTLDGAQFASLGTAASNFGGMTTVTGGAGTAFIAFGPREHFEATLGDWVLDGSGSDFTIDLQGLHGSSFTLTATAAVPEPQTYALMLAGLGMAGWVLRRRS